MASSQLVTLTGLTVDLGIDAGCVVQVALSREWMDAEPIDLAARLGWQPALAGEDDASGGRVLVVRSRHGDVPVRATGKVGLCTAEAAEVLALPPEVLVGDAAAALAAVVIAERRRAVLVLAPEGLWRLFELSV